MGTLEQVIFDKVRILDTEQQQRVLDFLESIEPKAFDFEAWWRGIHELQAALRQEYGENYTIGVQDLLDEVREEASWLRG